jgi:hypothetical protein
MPSRKIRNALLITSVLTGCTAAAVGTAQGLRAHTATTTRNVDLVPATQSAPGQNEVSFSTSGNLRRVTSNSIPNHLVGEFPNAENPNTMSEHDFSLQMPLNPKKASRTTGGQGWTFGVSLNGVVFDPFGGEFWEGSREWNYDPFGNAVGFGLDANSAHVQPTGKYHYHGIPFGLLELLRYDASQHSPLVGYAADGFPIYALTGVTNRGLTQMTSSYRLKSGTRPTSNGPGGTYDGAFVNDWEYVSGSGNLDECNGAMTTSAEYPNGTYAYFLTTEFPFVPRCFTGTPDSSFQHGGGGGARPAGGPPRQGRPPRP